MHALLCFKIKMILFTKKLRRCTIYLTYLCLLFYFKIDFSLDICLPFLKMVFIKTGTVSEFIQLCLSILSTVVYTSDHLCIHGLRCWYYVFSCTCSTRIVPVRHFLCINILCRKIRKGSYYHVILLYGNN